MCSICIINLKKIDNFIIKKIDNFIIKNINNQKRINKDVSNQQYVVFYYADYYHCKSD